MTSAGPAVAVPNAYTPPEPASPLADLGQGDTPWDILSQTQQR